jgi:hypothetical protein
MKTFALQRDGYIGSFLTGFSQETIDVLAQKWLEKGVQDLRLFEVNTYSYINDDGKLCYEIKDKILCKIYKGE